MDGNTMRSVAEYMSKRKSRDRKGNGPSELSAEYTKAEFDTNGIQRDWSGDERCYQDTAG